MLTAGRKPTMPSTIATSWPGACDCHIHVYDSAYPLLPDLPVTPPDAPVSRYLQVQQALGLERAIVVQPLGYGFDNSCTVDSIALLGPGARGICVVAPDVPDAEIRRLHDAGVRGVRFMMLGGALGWETLEPMAKRLQGFGWMVNLQLDGRTMPDHEA